MVKTKLVKWSMLILLMCLILIGIGGFCSVNVSKSSGGSSAPTTTIISGQVYLQTSDNNMVPLGGATVTAHYSDAAGSVCSKSTKTRSDGSYEITGIPLNTAVTVTVTSPDTIQSTEVITTTAVAGKAVNNSNDNSSALLKGKGKKIGLIKKNQDSILNTFDDDAMPKCQVSIPANAVNSDVDNVYLTATHQGENLSALPDGYIFLAGADFSSSSPITFTSGKEATPYIILPPSVKAEDLSTADIKLMEFIDGNWVINTGKGKVFTTGEWLGYIGPDDIEPAKVKGVRPFAWVKVQPSIATINGTISNASGAPIKGVFVFGGGSKTYTGSVGTYTLKNIAVIKPNTLIPINASADGYQLANQFVSLSPGGTVNNANFTLEPIAVTQLGEVYGKVTDGAYPLYGAIVTLQTNPSIRGMKYDNKNTSDLTDDTFFVIPPPGVNVTNYKWMLTFPDNTKFTSAIENGSSVVLNQLATEAGINSTGAYKVELEVTYTGGKKSLVSGGFLLKQSGFVLYIADVKLPLSLPDDLWLKAMANETGDYQFIKLPPGETFNASAKADGFIASNTVQISALSAGEKRLQNFALSALSTDTDPPTAPGAFTGTAQTSFSILLTWSASTDNVGIDYYRVYRGILGVPGLVEIGKTTNTFYLDSGLTPGTTYKYQVGAVDKANWGTNSDVINITTPADVPDTENPTTPTNLAATVIGPTQINLSWAGSTDNVGVIGYQVYRSTDGSNYPVSFTLNAATSYSNNGLTASTSYWYKITAYDGAGNISDFSNVVNATTASGADTTPPSVPVMNGAVALSSGSIGISWTASTDNVGVTGYKVYRSTNGISYTLRSTLNATTSYDDTGLSASTLYYYKVAAVDGAGNTSAQSSAANATTQAAGGGNQLVAYWKFDETSGTLAADSSGYGNNGTVYGATWSGGCLSFDGSNDYVVVPKATSLEPSEITISFWMNRGSNGTGEITLLRKADHLQPGYVMRGTNAAFSGAFAGSPCTTNYSVVYADISSYVSQWAHYTLTYSQSNGSKFYINGVLVSTDPTIISGGLGHSGDLSIGGSQAYSGAGYIEGKLSDMKIYNYARTSEQIQAEYNASSAAYWTQKIAQGAGGSPSGRNYQSMVWDGQRVIMFGGYDGSPKNDLWWYDPVTNTWTQKIAQGAGGSPIARYSYSMVWDGTRVIMFGGCDGSTYKNDLWWYDPVGNTWTQKIANGAGGSPVGRSAHSMVWDGTRVIMFGGSDGSSYRNDLWWYDPTGNTWTQKIAQGTGGSPSARVYHPMVWDGTRMIMFGGAESSSPWVKNDLWWYDPTGNTWTQKIAQNTAGSPPARGQITMDWDGQRVIVFGGNGSTPYMNDLWWYDPVGNTWTQKIAQGTAGSPTARYGHSTAWDGQRVIMFGGWDGSKKNDLWWYEVPAVDDYVWVANSGPDNVSRINKSDLSATTIATGDVPFGVAVDETYCWVSNANINTVTRIKKSDLSTTTIVVGTGPYGVAVDATYCWVTNSGSNNVTRIQKSDLTTTTITVGSSPMGVAVDGTYCWVTNEISNNLTRILKSDLSTTTIAVGNRPYGVAVDPNYVWVANYNDNNVTRILKSNPTITTTITVGNLPYGVAVDETYCWVVNRDSNNVTRIKKSDLTTTTIATGTRPYGVAVDATYCWVVNYISNNVTRIKKSDLTTTTIAVGTGPFSFGDMTGYAYDNYANLAVTAVDDYVWVSNVGSNNVSRILKSNPAISTTIAVGTSPQGIAVDPTYVWVTNGADNNVTRIKKSDLGTTTITAGSTPKGVAVDGTYCWVSNQGSNNVTRIKKSDLTTTTIAVGSFPSGVAVDASYVWVVNRSSNTVTRILKSDLSTTTIGVGSWPVGVAVDETYCWVANRLSNSVTRILKSDLSTTTITVGTNPCGVAVDGTYCWVATNYSGVTRILKSDSSTTTITVAAIPYGIAVDGTYCWASNSSGVTRILKFDSSTTTIELGTDPESLGDMTGYAYDNYAK